MTGWRRTTIGDEITFQRGFDITRKFQRDGNIPVVSSGGIGSYHDESAASGPGVVIGRKGTLGKVFYLEGDYWPHDTTLWVKDFKGSWPKFVYYFMTQLDTTWLDAGSANPTLNRNHLHPLKIVWPPAADQRAIAEVLGALDDKIAANARLISAADGLSHALFQSVATHSDSLPLSATARFVNGKAFTKGASGTGRVVIRIAELNSGIGGSTVFSDAEVEDDFLAGPGDILFAWSGSLTVHRWFRREAIINQHIFKVIPNGYPSWLVYELLRKRLPYFKGIAADKATTMGHIQRRRLDELVDIPSRSAISRLDALMSSLWARMLLAERENETLAATRDALLPQLMSGALRVKDAEKVLEEVV